MQMGERHQSAEHPTFSYRSLRGCGPFDETRHTSPSISANVVLNAYGRDFRGSYDYVTTTYLIHKSPQRHGESLCGDIMILQNAPFDQIFPPVRNSLSKSYCKVLSDPCARMRETTNFDQDESQVDSNQLNQTYTVMFKPQCPCVLTFLNRRQRGN